MKFNPMPPIERVRELLSYFPETGLFKWKVTLSNRAKAGSNAGAPNNKGYVEIKIDNVRYKAHRLAWFYVYGEDPSSNEIDHEDLNKGNNKIGNLRLATRKQNNENIGTPRNNTSGVRGVSYQKKDSRWTAYIYHNKKRIHLGSFKDLSLAAMVRQNAEAQMFTHSSIKGEA
jgi:hypothetical protein